jgi:predicted nucleotide-binding protein
VIILATGDDTVRDKKTGVEIIQPRQNVIHEIGLAQKSHPGRIIYLLEEGANFPSNIKPKVWESFKQRNMMDAFLGIVRELRAYGILKVIRHPVEGLNYTHH